MSCGVGRRRGSDLVLLWLCCRPAATAPIGHLAGKPLYAADEALKRTKRQKIYVYVYVCVYIYICICVCVYIYIYTHTHIYLGFGAQISVA